MSGFVPIGLGKWKFHSHNKLGQDFPGNPLEWIREPPNGAKVVLKIDQTRFGPDFSLDRERSVLMRANQVFASDQQSRPVRLFGYGATGGDESGFQYLVIEHFEPDFCSINNLLSRQKIGRLQVKEALRVGVQVARVLKTLHVANLYHGDLDGVEAQDHILWSGETENLRLIDFNSGGVIGGSSKLDGRSVDQIGLIQLVYRCLTGNEYGGNIDEIRRFLPGNDSVNQFTEIVHSWFKRPDNSPTQITEELYESLFAVLESVS